MAEVILIFVHLFVIICFGFGVKMINTLINISIEESKEEIWDELSSATFSRCEEI